jgi:hypothetical protein
VFDSNHTVSKHNQDNYKDLFEILSSTPGKTSLVHDMCQHGYRETLTLKTFLKLTLPKLEDLFNINEKVTINVHEGILYHVGNIIDVSNFYFLHGYEDINEAWKGFGFKEGLHTNDVIHAMCLMMLGSYVTRYKSNNIPSPIQTNPQTSLVDTFRSKLASKQPNPDIFDHHTVLAFGKYKGKKISSMIENDPGYVVYLSGHMLNFTLDEYVLNFARLLIEERKQHLKSMSDRISMGKHTGKTFQELKDNEPGYFSWLIK